MRDQLRERNPSVMFKLIDSPEGATTNFTNIVLPYGAFDLQASYPFYENATNYFPIRRAANDSQYTLGRTLLQEAYLIVDYENTNFTIAQAIFPDPLPPANIVAILPPGSSSHSQSSKARLSTGAKAGIAIASVAFAFLMGFLLFLCLRRKQQRQKSSNISELEARHLSEAASLAVISDRQTKLVVLKS